MNRNTILFLILFLSTGIFGQDDYRMGVFFGYSSLVSNLSDEDMYKSKDFSLEYHDRIFSIFSIGYGLMYARQKVQYNINRNSFGPTNFAYVNRDLLSLYMNFKIYNYRLEYLYVFIGPILDFELQRTYIPNYIPQDGLGFSIGLGFEVPLEKIVFSLEPSFKFRRLVQFRSNNDDSDLNDKFPLYNYGLRLGIAYKFF